MIQNIDVDHYNPSTTGTRVHHHDVGRYVIVRTRFRVQHASGIRTPLGNSFIFTQDFSSVKLPTQGMTYRGW
jgi:hypothetical protein